MFAVARDDPAIADPYVGLVNVLDTRNLGLFTAQNSRISDCFRVFQLHPKQRPRDGDPVMVPGIGTFKTHWNLYTENMLAGLDWKGVVAAGGVPYETVCIRTKNTISVHSKYPFRVVQIVLRLYASIGEILAGFDVDAPCFAFDGQLVWGSPRGIGAVMRRANTVDMSRRSPSMESRFAKYATRGYEVLIPSLKLDEVDVRIYLRHPSKLQGLARLLSLEHIATSDTNDGIVDSRIINDITKSFDAMENNDYAHFHIPYGPNWDAIKITASVSNANFVMNDEVMQTELGLGDDSWRLHRHPAFYGTAEQCITGTCLVSQMFICWPFLR
ncbi:hypothetical protein IW261DRAFT_1327273 [Armillaria novae-zelandiae]|uniref:Uncharacterized protein n=1 Tax=Armillaria novae-zelandiae TaxID=153914 RepID=A0AA39TGQ2_9AGAR|nr:hypothetical protein IW261DRAFT_1348378 [Armillaria novae-zelandiae]KAK0487931.1 hypothetical protein IW261DRAFT_1327273 [Armillaria novae-zelandiae]